ncbi:MAG: T6SS immunity protein Tdi1 domain-containing protein [Pseudomonadota bacterium]
MVTIEDISEAWGWKGLRPTRIVAINAFGNVIIEDTTGQYWRIIPEEWSAEIIASDFDAFSALESSEEFTIDWEMSVLVKKAQSALGPVSQVQCYCLKIPALLGGQYSIDNIGMIDRIELLQASGDCAKQIEGLPDSAKVRIEITE